MTGRPGAGGGGRIFLVECYWPGIEADRVLAAVRDLELAAREMTREGRPVRYLHGTFLPAEEVLLCLLRARSAREVRNAGERGHVRVDRIAQAMVLPSSRPSSRGRRGPCRHTS